jgi:UDP-2-acetamido-2-deoxy-ribo-hexuluronate aminotransferase
MQNIKMVDLRGQYLKIKNEVDDAIQRVIDSTAFVKGSIVREFEENLSNYLNVNHVISCGNGTDAIQVAIMSLNLEKGSEIITPDFTFIATVEAIVMAGYKPVLVDVEKDTFNISIESLKNAITSKTKAILPVHLYGQASNMEEIQKVAKERNLYVIEDNAQAIGSDYYFSDGSTQKTGTIGDIGTTSFFPSKNLGCFGDGGAIFTNDDELAKRCRSIVNHGMEKRYYHDRIGVNSRLDGIQAAILNVKLQYLDNYNSLRSESANIYNNLLNKLGDVKTPLKSKFSDHIYHQYTVQVDKRDELKEFLERWNIPSMIYYPVPIHQQKAFNDFHHSGGYQNSVYLSEKVLSLPMHTELTIKEQEYICDKIQSFY